MKTTHLFLPALALSLCLQALGQPLPTELRLERSPAGPMRLELLGEPGLDYTIEAADALGPDGWSPLFTFSLAGPSQSAFDPGSPGLPQRFYRAVAYDGPAPSEVASNFRLIDQDGKSRELSYHWTDTNVAAFVLVFTANGCAAVRDFLPALNALRSQFEPRKVRFWMINSQPQDTRSNIVNEAAALGLTLPVLHDRAQLVAHAYHTTVAPEALVVGRSDFPGHWTIVYRGALDDRIGGGTGDPTQRYLADALTAYLAGEVPVFKRTPVAGCDVPMTPTPAVSYSADIAPLLLTKCVACHSPGNIAPWSMTNYDIVASYGQAIRANVLEGHMPPWHADPEYGVFSNDSSLTPLEARQLLQWIDAGAPRGSGPDPLAGYLPSLAYPFEWPAELGPPDAILTYPLQTIPAFGIVDYRYLTLPSPFSSNAWLRAAVVLPSTPRAAHHETIQLNPAPDNANIGVYAPGTGAWVYPPGTRRLLPKGASIEISLHYVTSGTPQTDLPRVGFYLARDSRLRTLTGKPIGWGSDGFGVQPPIQPYAREDVRTASYTLGSDIYLWQFQPHMHLRGSWMKYEAIYPGGGTELLLSVPHYHPHVQTLYQLAQPKRLPARTTIRVTGAFDNSPQNEKNPAPAQLVNWGPQLKDEMFSGLIQYTELLTITSQPRNRNVARGTTAKFSVTAPSPNPPIRYEWRFNGSALAGATNSSLTLTNAQSVHEGDYSVVVTDQFESVTSNPAVLRVGDPLVITQQPAPQTVAVGDNATFSVSVTGTPPFGFSWSKMSTVLTNFLQSETTSTFTLFNVSPSDAGDYRVTATNDFGAGVTSPLVPLTVTGP